MWLEGTRQSNQQREGKDEIKVEDKIKVEDEFEMEEEEDKKHYYICWPFTLFLTMYTNVNLMLAYIKTIHPII